MRLSRKGVGQNKCGQHDLLVGSLLCGKVYSAHIAMTKQLLYIICAQYIAYKLIYRYRYKLHRSSPILKEYPISPAVCRALLLLLLRSTVYTYPEVSSIKHACN